MNDRQEENRDKSFVFIGFIVVLSMMIIICGMVSSCSDNKTVQNSTKRKVEREIAGYKTQKNGIRVFDMSKDYYFLNKQKGYKYPSKENMKYYAVKLGRQTGIFETWGEAEAQVKGFPNAKFKSFSSFEEAKSYLEDSNQSQSSNLVEYEAYVDGSFDKNKNMFWINNFFDRENDYDKNIFYIISKNGVEKKVDIYDSLINDWDFQNDNNRDSMIVKLNLQRDSRRFFEGIEDNQDMDENTTIGTSDYSDR